MSVHIWLRASCGLVLSLVSLAAAPAWSQAASSATVVTSTSNPSSYGQSVTFTATVAGLGGGAPTGSVTFSDGSTTLGTATVNTLGIGQVLAGGHYHNCALTSIGGVKCWGYNYFGQLGDGTLTTRQAPVDVIGLEDGVVAVVAGIYHTCAVTVAGGVKCWGLNAYSQLGDGTTTDSATPVDVSGLPEIVGIMTLDHHTCILSKAGGIKCWGNNFYGQIDDGPKTYRVTPLDISGLTSGVSAIDAGSYFMCAVTNAGGAKCWGDNQHGKLGDGTMTNRSAPGDVSGLTSGVSAISAGFHHTCALTTVGGVKCWGDNGHGELGDSTTIERLTPVDVSGLTSGVSAISAGGEHTCALTGVGGVKCWGGNDFGQVGDGTTAQRFVPVDVIGLTSGVSAIAVGEVYSCALTSAGVVKCWGRNRFGEVGDGTGIDRHTPADVTAFTPLVFGRATYSTAALAAGSHPITAIYGGDGNHTASTSPVLTQVVDPIATTTALVSSQNPSAFGQSVTFTATVSSNGGAPTGSVAFKDGASTFGTATLSGGTVTFATAALGAGTHTITAAYGGGGNFAASTSTALAQTVLGPPTVTSVGPSSGPILGGTTVNIAGTNFTGATGVTFGGTAGTIVSVASATSIMAKTPVHASGAVTVAVTAPAGTGSKPAAYTYLPVPPPTVTAVSPNSGPTAGGTTVTITGTNFTGATGVTFGGTAATIVSVASATSIIAKTPAHAPGAVTVAVTRPGGTGSKPAAYTYVSAPTVTAVSANSGPMSGGSTVIISGTNFTGATAVTFGGTAATIVNVAAAAIIAKTPAHAAGGVTVAVTTPGGIGGKSAAYTYLPAPTVTSVSPGSGPSSGGSTVTITGTNFTGATAVKFGGITATNMTVVNASKITAKTPPHAAGPVVVAVTAPGGTGSKSGAYSYVP